MLCYVCYLKIKLLIIVSEHYLMEEDILQPIKKSNNESNMSVDGFLTNLKE